MKQQSILKKTVSEEFEDWLEWASKKIDWYDPDINLEDEALKDVDKDSVACLSQ